MSNTRRYHCQTVLIAILNRVFVADGTTRLNNRRDTRFTRNFDTVGEGKKRIGSHDRTRQIEPERMGFLDSLLQGIDPRGLPHSTGNQLVFAGQYNGI